MQKSRKSKRSVRADPKAGCCPWCDLPLKAGEPLAADCNIPQHAICSSIIEAHNQASLDAYVTNHNCTPEEAFAALFPDFELRPAPEP